MKKFFTIIGVFMAIFVIILAGALYSVNPHLKTLVMSGISFDQGNGIKTLE